MFKSNDPNVRLLGVNVSYHDNCARIYILTSDRKLNVLEIRRRVKSGFRESE